MDGEDEHGLSIMEHLLGALVYGWGTILALLVGVAIAALGTFLTVDYLRDRNRRRPVDNGSGGEMPLTVRLVMVAVMLAVTGAIVILGILLGGAGGGVSPG